jgi:hypothetical protein
MQRLPAKLKLIPALSSTAAPLVQRRVDADADADAGADARRE